jgi:hypothetical protein
MAFPATVTYTFGTLTGAVPLSYLDTNFTNLTTFINGIGSGTNALTTPVLGTPTSGSLTNCTNFPAANLSGTLSIAKGGTGQTTATAAINALLPSQTGNSGKYLTTNGTNTSWVTIASAGSVTNVSWTGGIVSIANPTTTPAFTIAGTSGGIPYFSTGTTWASSAILASNALMVGGGAGGAPSTVTTGTGVVTALGVNTGSAGAFVVNGGALGTPSSGTVTNLTGTASININGTVGATTRNSGLFTTLGANGAVTIQTSTNNQSYTTTGAGTIAISSGTAGSINNMSIGATTASTGSFTSITATSKGTAGVFATNSGLTANTTVTNQATFTTAGLTLASQTAAAGSVWRITAFGQFTAASSGTARTAQIACFWGSTQLTAITPSVLVSTAQTTQWQAQFILTATSTTAIWTTGTLTSRVASATALAIDNATPASTTVTAGAQTLDLRVRVSTAVAAESWIIQQVTIERLE